MIQINEKKTCCGCTACYSVCPRKCIQMQQDEEGFLYPVIDMNLCINCSLCEKVCPMNSYGENKISYDSIFLAMQNKNEIARMESTVGGAFSIIANYLIENGAYVYACGYDKMIVCHKKTDKKQDLSEMRGSKYVQSELKDTYKMIKEDLKTGNTVLFVGTPCQVNGLKKVVGDPQNLFTIDLLCLGVSSPKIFKDWISFLNKYYSDTVINVEFRNKRYGYSTPNVRIYFKNRKPIEQKYYTRVHSKLFFNGYNVRPSCYDCKFRKEPRISDFTIGDFSNIGQYSHDMDDDKGTTRVWVHTKKGKELLEKVDCNTNILVIKESTKNIIYERGKGMPYPNDRNLFFYDAKTMDYYSLISKWEPETIKDKVIQIFRPMLNNLPFHTLIFRLIRNVRNAKFEKMLDSIDEIKQENIEK